MLDSGTVGGAIHTSATTEFEFVVVVAGVRKEARGVCGGGSGAPDGARPR